MVKKTKGKHRLDKFYHLAKEQGYRSRAAFKLVQLNRQFHFLDRAHACLDLCAAPGGWMQVAVKTMPLNSLVIGIDLDPIKPIKGARSLVGDITTAKARAAIKKEADGSMMEVVLHDGAPNVGGVWASEAYSQSALVLEALKLATDTLVPNGVFVTKIFRSQDYNALLYAFKQLFNRVEATKPAASRNTSAEIFVVCQGYKAPAKIDPRLLDPKHLFQEVAEPAKVMGPDALLKQKIKQKRFRDGYAEGLSSLHRQTTAATFIASEHPVEMLGQFTRFALDDPEEQPAGGEGKDLGPIAMLARSHPDTTTEIRTLLGDLQVLGRSEFKLLLKWRLKIKKALALAAAEAAPPTATEDPGAAVEAEEKDEEAALLEEMEGVRDKAAKRQKRDKKRRLESKKKSRIRAAQLAMGEGVADEAQQEPLFSLASMKGSVRAAEIGDDAEVPDEDAAEDSDDESADGSDSGGDSDSDSEQRRYEAEQEEAMEEAYQSYLERQGQRAKAARAKRARLGKTGDLGSGEEADDDVEPAPVPELREEPEVGGGLLVKLDRSVGRAKTPAAVAAQWFAQNIFKGADADDLETDAPAAKRTRTATASLAIAETAPSPKDPDKPLVPKAPKAADGQGPDDMTAAKVADLTEFEEVPVAESDAESAGSSDTEMEEPDEQTAAELRAMAKVMLNGRSRRDVLDGAYHRYAFHDDRLPRWFAEDEQRHMRPPAILSKDDIEAEKQRFRAIDARPIKKVAEAKARKKKRLQVRLEQAKSKANSIVEQGDLSDRAKAKEVEKLYAKARAGKAAKKKPTRGDKYKKKGPPVDRRLLSDKRPVNNKAKKAVAKARKKKGGAKGKGQKGR